MLGGDHTSVCERWIEVEQDGLTLHTADDQDCASSSSGLGSNIRTFVGDPL